VRSAAGHSMGQSAARPKCYGIAARPTSDSLSDPSSAGSKLSARKQWCISAHAFSISGILLAPRVRNGLYDPLSHLTNAWLRRRAFA
jgi:hypothetical protein